MKNSKSFQIVSLALFAVAITSILFKLHNGYLQTDTFEDGLRYSVTYEFDYQSEKEKDVFVRAFLPSDNFRQRITNEHNIISETGFSKEGYGINQIGLWNDTAGKNKERIAYNFNVHLKPVRHDIDPLLKAEEIKNYGSGMTYATAYIESEDPRILSLAKQLATDRETADEVITSIFSYVYEIPTQPIKELMTATEVLEKNAASCNGKSRLFVALCRALRIPSRVAGGIILNEERKKTTHLWAEVKIQDQWIPFDPLNGYYAYMPANYLEVYKGDEFFVKRSSDMIFNYNYDIKLIEEEGPMLSQLNMFYISGQSGLSPHVLAMLMLLPLGALVVAIFRNVIGMKTFGVFLPVLIAISFTSTGLLTGIISFVVVLMLISLLHYPLLKWGIMYVPKLVVMLSAVIFIMIILMLGGLKLNVASASALTFFPIIILTISAEKYARIVVEEGFQNASKILLQTIIVTLFCYMLVSSQFIFLMLMNFPEVLLLVMVSSLLLGKWVGLRIAEYKRFGWVIS